LSTAPTPLGLAGCLFGPPVGGESLPPSHLLGHGARMHWTCLQCCPAAHCASEWQPIEQHRPVAQASQTCPAEQSLSFWQLPSALGACPPALPDGAADGLTATGVVVPSVAFGSVVPCGGTTTTAVATGFAEVGSCPGGVAADSEAIGTSVRDGSVQPERASPSSANRRTRFMAREQRASFAVSPQK
jgi:hypothetical protein